ncbi:MAG: transketolase, partial [Chitinophagaceae bacterium]
MSSTLKDSTLKNNELTFEQFKAEVLNDYKLAAESREASLRGRKEVLTGKAKFGIFGDGKELAQIAMAKAFQEGDFRSGYYRDQTFMFAIKMANIQQFFAQLYANPDLEHDPFSAGRQMNAHFSTRSLDENGLWKNLTEIKNSSADSSPTASQMTRALGLSFASKLYRASDELKDTGFSNNGNEVCFCTIGDASTSEGLFWETVNAAGVLKAPLAISIWDDGYGISVPKKYQTTKGDISTLLEGFRVNEKGEGFEIYKVNGWDYAALCETYAEGIKKVRETHIPAIFHITEVTQPQGHSTSGSHERYKSKKRLEWEQEFDCIKKFKEWILANNIAEEDELSKIDAEAAEMVNTSKKEAWKAYISPVKNQIKEAVQRISQLGEKTAISQINELADSLKNMLDPIRKDAVIHLKKALWFSRETESPERQSVSELLEELLKENKFLYNSHLTSESEESPLKIEIEEAVYEEDAKTLNGFEILNACFDENINRDPRIFAFGEDVGKIGDVNQAFAGLQEKYGELRIFDTGIREATIIGQG